MVDNVPVSGGNVRMDIPASRSLQPIQLSMPKSKERPIRAPDDLLTVPEVAERLRRSRAAVYRLIARRSLPVYDIPGSYLFKAADVEAFLESCRTEARSGTSYGRPKN
jgi:excisionase family DNA binding protein